jgi:autophagy-related protein 9
VILYCILFTVYGLFSLWSFWQSIQDSLVMKSIFENRLGISQQRLEGGAVDWDRDVVSKLISLQESGEYQILIHGQANLDALYIAQRILRKDNFMVAFFNRGMLDLQVPFIPFQDVYCKSLEWAIYFCIQNYMFNHKFQVRPGFYLDPKSLQRRFFLCGIAHAIFLPFLAFFMLLHFLMQNGYDWKAKKQYLGPKEWSLAAKWTFREFNELPHFFERRLEPSYDATEKYLELFRQNEIMTTIGRIFVFIGGAFASVLFAFAAVNDAILLHIKIGNFNLLWFVGVATMFYSIGKSMLPDPEAHARSVWNLNEELERTLNVMATHTHYYPDTWKGKGYDMRIMSQIKRMFTNKTSLFVHELISLLLAPLVLCFSLPRCAEHLCEFVMTVKADVPGAGDICGYATFDFDTFGDHSFEGKTMGEVRGAIASSLAELQNVEATTRLHPKPRAYHGKMEKSFFSFKSCHPSWISTKSGQTLIDRVELFKQNEMKALALEQQQHLEAAVRQLGTLDNLVTKQNTETSSPMVDSMLDNYIGLHTPLPLVSDTGKSTLVDSVHIQVEEYVARLSSALLSSQHGMQLPAKFIPRRWITDSQVVTRDMQESLIYEKSGIPNDRSFLHHDNDPDEQQRHQEQVQYMWLQQYHSQQNNSGN